MSFDWLHVRASGQAAPATVDPRRRMAWLLAGLGLLLAIVFGRLVQLEWAYGAAFRAEANRPQVRRVSLPGIRGRILARDGSVLACDEKVFGLAVHYRYLQEPVSPAWLRLTARARLTPAERRQPARVAAAEQDVLRQRRELAEQLAQGCGLSAAQWEARVRAIQARVERISQRANRNASDDPALAHDTADADSPSLAARLWNALNPPGRETAPHITVAEELAYHVVTEDAPPAFVAEIQSQPARFAGVKIVALPRRRYPAGMLAAHVLGYLGYAAAQEAPADDPVPPDARVGRAGLELRYENVLRGRDGLEAETTDHAGHIVSTVQQREAAAGRDLVLTLDARLQATAETLLDQALQREADMQPADIPPGGGAVVVIDVRGGEILAAASAPRFAPQWFTGQASERVAAALADRASPLLDRTAAMALPPGSLFKVIDAVAFLQQGQLDPHAPFHCRGYLDHPDQWRCPVFIHQGHGHGDVTLGDALAQSCNVYFLAHARALGPDPLCDWAARFGLGARTGVDVPGESAGMLGNPASLAQKEQRPWRSTDTLALAIGQGPIAATPLQIVRLMAAVANGGRLVRPHLVAGLGRNDRDEEETFPAAATEPIGGLQPSTLTALREGLRRVVGDPQGTGHATVDLPEMAIAGKTGTAQTGGGLLDHAWFAGYFPTEEPRFALVVVLEHAGNAGAAAGPVAKRLVLRMVELGLVQGAREGSDRLSQSR